MSMPLRRCSLLGFLGVGWGAALGAGAPEPPPAAGVTVDFARDIRPILARNCYECHGPERHKAALRLDRKEHAFRGGDSGPPFEPGNAAESLLIESVEGVDPEFVMPPKGARLSAREIGLLRAWIDGGAAWPDGVDDQPVAAAHWAFRPPVRPEVPAVEDPSWARNPIDRFILARLEAEGVAPSPEADRATLLRRLSLDLRGLPPTIEEVDAFLADDRPDAYERVVEAMLASPAFGERWARHWLDLARYADSDGYEKDSPRPNAWRWRDWVIDAINRDLPFDRFTVEQLAGDLLPGATDAQKLATGFHRNTLTNREGGVDPEEFRVAAVVDRVNTTGSTWLGLTVGCAQCHDHKYDPIAQREFYGLFAFFNADLEKDLPAPPRPEELAAYREEKAAFDAAHAPLVRAVEAYERDERPARQAAWEADRKPRSARWAVLEPSAATSAGGTTFARQDDGWLLAEGSSPITDSYTLSVATDLTGITAFRLEVDDDPTLPMKGPGRAPNGNFVLSELTVTAAPRGEPGAARPVALKAATADFSQDGWDVAAAIDGDPQTGWAVSPQFGRAHVAVFETAEDVGSPCGTVLTFTLDQRFGQAHTLGRLRIAAIAADRPVRADDPPEDVLAILALAPGDRSESQRARVTEYHRSIDPGLKALRAKVEAHAKKAPKKPAPTAMTLARNPDPPATHILHRGDFLQPGAEVVPHTPAVLNPLDVSGKTPDRLDLARWLVDPSNPLTARVAVNRVWQHLFGRALVASVEDFGTRGELPSHPELLDWLATEYPARGWSRKAMIRLIVTSATYRQASRARPELADRDPNNVWLARQNRFRVEAEVIRDLALAASGRLAPRVGGPSVRPPQPAGISDLTYAGSARWVESRGADRYRRGLYTWFQRTSPFPMLTTFDAPDANVCAVRRERSNTPLQALTLLNDTTFVACARALGRRIVEEAPRGGPGDRITLAFRLALARSPSESERAVLSRLFEDLRRAAADAPPAAAALLGDDRPEGVEPAEAAAWVALARTVLNLDEFVTRE